MPTEVAPPMLEIAPSARKQVGPLAVIAAFFILYPLMWAVEIIPGWLALAGIVVFGSVGALGIISALRSPGWGWVLRIDADGVTVRDRLTIPWEDVAEVVATSLQPRRFFRSGRPLWPVVAIVPRPGVTMPPVRLPAGLGPSNRFGAGFRERRYGTRLVLAPHVLSVSTEEILFAVQRWGHVTVSDRRRTTRP